MRSAIASLRPGGTVKMSGEQFARLAELIQHLAEQDSVSDVDSFCVPMDGIRWWVPLPEFERAREELDALRVWHDGFASTR